MKFEIGNTVKVIKNDGFGHEVGTIGIVKDLEKAPNKHVLVQDMNKTYNLWHKKSELELYEEKKETTMKNLLETEFVIENCTLSQRLAIKAYCDEKKVAYIDLEVPSYKTLTFSDGKFRGFVNSVVQRDVVTFSELIQFLDQYQPEPEFKVGDIVVVESWHHAKIKLPQTCELVEIIKDVPTPFKIKLNKDHWEYKNEIWNFKKGEFRHATPEEIKKWKEENEIKLPKIADYSGMFTTDQADTKILKWGCTEISISTIKELLEVGLDHITIKGYHIVDSEIKQIKKFIEHNKL